MSPRYYGPLLGLAASLSLVLAGCGSDRPPDSVASPAGATPAARAAAQKVASTNTDNTDETLWTWLGLAKRQSLRSSGPQTGSTVSPELWQAVLDTLNFAGISSEDPVTGLLVTKWYSPPGKPDERLRVTAFVLARALRSDSVAVTIERQVRSPDGQWQSTPVAREAVDGLDNDILQRAQQIHAKRYRETVYQ
jgi:Domain of unknown function (DUF3576)